MAIINGTAERDDLLGTNGPDTILGLGGRDRLRGKDGDDTLRGGGDGDRLLGEVGADRLFGDDGGDVLIGGRGDDRVFGGRGDDVLQSGTNSPSFGPVVPDGNDVYDGGEGRDTYAANIGFNQPGMQVTLGQGGADGRAVQGASSDILRRVENVTATNEDDRIIGNELANVIEGASGNDHIEGRGGDDVLTAEPSFDERALVDGGSGNDHLSGWFGADLLRTGADEVEAFTDGVLGREIADDSIDLGRDAQRDVYRGSLEDTEFFEPNGMAIDVISGFRLQDRLDVRIVQELDDRSKDISIKGFLDSDRNGTIDDADADVRLEGGDLVLDLDALTTRARGTDWEGTDQHIVLSGVTSFNVDQLL